MNRFNAPADEADSGEIVFALTMLGARRERGFDWEQGREVIDDVEAIRQELEHWRSLPARAKVWSYHPTLSTLQIRLEKIGYPHNFTIVCLGTMSMSGPFGWDDAALEIQFRTEDVIFEKTPVKVTSWILVDTAASFEVVCDGIKGARDVPPVY